MKPIGFVFIVFLMFGGCGTTQHFVPSLPLEKGEIEWRVSIGASTSNFSAPSLQFGLYGGLSSRDVVRFSCNNFPFPTSLGYAHYFGFQGTDSWAGNMQLHAGNILMNEYNPDFEFDMAISSISTNSSHTARVGVGYYTTPLMARAFGYADLPNSFVPILAYQLEGQSIELEAEIIFGLSRHFVAYYRQEKRDTLKQAVVIAHDSVRTITQRGDDYRHATWEVYLTNGDSLSIMNRDPYPDCIECENMQRGYQAYSVSDDFRVIWVYGKRMTPIMLEINMKAALSDYKAGGDLILLEQPGLSRVIQDQVKLGLEDIGFSVGYRKRRQ